MYRIAVIQNGVEMQHSGYVDAIPMYKNFAAIGRERAEFTRFSGVNIRDLFSPGEKYLLDFDALILGTNATSDDDVYNVLREPDCKNLLETFISKGKGVLICSQKKYQHQEEDVQPSFKLSLDAKNDDFMRILEDTGKGELYYTVVENERKNQSKKRVSGFLPAKYEYIIDERNDGEKSSVGSPEILNFERANINQRCIVSLPHVITNEKIESHCTNNSFQKHYYRDVIFPIYDSSYQSIIIDKSAGVPSNLLMVAVPQKRERIVISTMALDWAGHKELLENIVNYLTRGIPHTAFVHKDNYDNSEMKILTLDAELSKIGNMQYCNLEDCLKNIHWHSLVVFSPDFLEQEVSNAWQIIKNKNKLSKVYHYRTVGDELVLVQYSNNTYIERQKMDVLTWLNSKRGRRLWNNSFWKTYDVAKLLFTMKDECCPSILNQIATSIIKGDDNDKKHYKTDGSYDGVLAPTCGVMELFSWAGGEEFSEYYDKTKNYLISKYSEENSTHNKMFILRSFHRCKDEALNDLINNFSFDEVLSFRDMVDLDLCLYAEISIILHCNMEENRASNKQNIITSLTELLKRQLQNGKWDSLSNTSSILIFLLQYYKEIKSILKDAGDEELLRSVKKHIDRGVAAIKTAYSASHHNWENNIVTTANSLLVLYLYDETSGYKSKDFLKHFIDEGVIASNYNSLNLALHTLDKAIDDLNVANNQLITSKKEKEELDEVNAKLERRLYVLGIIGIFSLLSLLSLLIQLLLKNPKELADILSELFMWIPVAVGTAVPALAFYINKKITNLNGDRKKSKRKTNKK